MKWPLLVLLGLLLVAVFWRERPRRAQGIALLVVMVGLGYVWLGLGKVA